MQCEGWAAGSGPHVLLSPAPSLRERNRPVLLLAFPSSESEAVVLKRGFWIVDQKMRPEVHAEVRIGLHSCSCCQDDFSIPGDQPGWCWEGQGT